MQVNYTLTLDDYTRLAQYLNWRRRPGRRQMALLVAVLVILWAIIVGSFLWGRMYAWAAVTAIMSVGGVLFSRTLTDLYVALYVRRALRSADLSPVGKDIVVTLTDGTVVESVGGIRTEYPWSAIVDFGDERGDLILVTVVGGAVMLPGHALASEDAHRSASEFIRSRLGRGGPLPGGPPAVTE